MSLKHALVCVTMLFVLLCLCYFSCLLHAKSSGFTVDLIHRDSPLSPLYNPLETPMDRYRNAINRSMARLHRYSLNAKTTIGTQLIADDNHFLYLIKYSIGSPAKEYYGAYDTGSDLLWLQCNPCISCFPQKLPIFNPEESTTYMNLPCKSEQCQLIEHECSRDNCEYTYPYFKDKIYTIGNLATESLTLSGLTFSGFTFGYGHNNSGLGEHETGFFGMGGGPLSFINQAGPSLGNLKFSHCLAPFDKPIISSKLIIGITETVGNSTQLIRKDDNTFYFVNMFGISVNRKVVPFSAQNGTNQYGNTIIDSGCSLMLLPQDFYNKVESALKDEIPLQPIPELNPQLCYHGDETGINAPKITIIFVGGAMQLNPSNTFHQVQDGVYCFTMKGKNTLEYTVLGSYAQSNFLIGFDLDRNIFSFMPKDCTMTE